MWYEEKPKHKLFDQYWSEHKALVYYMARKIGNKLNIDKEGLVGSLVLAFNYSLHYYEPTKGKFSTFFCRHLFKNILISWVRRESESWDVFVYNITSTKDDIKLTELNFAQSETDFFLYRIPEEDESDIDEIIGFFETANECWEFMTRYLEQRDKEIVSLYFRDNLSLQDIGNKFHITKERTRQLLDRSKLHIRSRIKMISGLAHLFS